MARILTQLSTADLKELAEGLRSGRFSPPYSAFGIGRLLPSTQVAEVVGELQRLSREGFTARQIGELLEHLVYDREQRRFADVVDLVWTGPETSGVASRDTAVVVRELFQNAERTVLIAGYAVYRGLVVFKTLADRMELVPDIRVRMFLDVKRPQGDTSSESEIVRRFAETFRAKDWPGNRLPEVYYDPRSLELDASKRASLHAKCVVVDESVSFVSSANFTEAAHHRNIEVGMIVRSPSFAKHLVNHFEALASNGSLRPVPLG